MSDFSRVTGLVSNLDTDGIVKSMLKADQLKVDRAKAAETRLEWKRDGYREITTMLKSFESAYFDLLNKESNMRLTSNYEMYGAKVQVNGEKSNAVSMKFSGASTFEKLEINEITQLATAETWSATRELKRIGGKVDLDKLNEALAKGGKNKELSIMVDGKRKNIEFKSNYASIDELKTDLQAKFNAALGEGVVEIGLKDGEINIDGNLHKLQVVGITDDMAAATGISNSATNFLDLSSKASVAMGITEKITLTLGNAEKEDSKITIDPTDTMEQVIDKINKGQKTATLDFEPVTGKFRLTAKETGATNEIVMYDQTTKDFFAKLGLDQSVRQRGKNAKAVINGEQVTLSSNEIEMNGAKITLNKTHEASEGKIELSKVNDTKALADKFRGFVKKYNEIVGKLKSMIGEKKNRRYDPLTQEQKKDMEKEDIEKWEDQAKQGLFRGDPILTKLLSDMRHAFNSNVDGAKIAMHQTGIKFTSNYKDGGKLEFDEVAFNKAIKEKGADFMKFFTGKSDKAFDTGHKEERFKESGVMERLNDIIKRNISPTVLSSKQRGALVQKAGIKGYSSENTAEISLKIRSMNKRVNILMDSMQVREREYYLKFSRLERALANITKQSSALAGLQ